MDKLAFVVKLAEILPTLCIAFSNHSYELSENPIRAAWTFGYANGRNLSKFTGLAGSNKAHCMDLPLTW